MLETADAALAARDPALPGLSLLLDAAALGEAINAAAPEARLAQVEKHYLRYKPGMNCLAAYRATRDGQTVTFHAKAHGADTEAKLGKAEERGSVEVAGLPGRLVLAELGVVVNFFPNDSKLKRLRRLGDDTKRHDLLAKLFPDQPQLWSGVIETLAYKPERRYVCRLTASDGTRRVLRFHTPAGYAALAAPPAPGSLPGGPRFSSRVAENPEYGIVAHDWLEGDLLRGLYCAQEWRPDPVRRAGHALARLHAGAGNAGVTATLPSRTLADEFNAIDANRRGLTMLTPHLAVLADSLAARLKAALERRAPALAMIHGDFYGKQILDTETGIAFLDLDELCLGHPAADLGLFVAHLELEVGYCMLTQARAGEVTAALLNGYSLGEGNVVPADLEAYIALGLYQLAHHPFRVGASHWPICIEYLLAICERHLDAAERLAGFAAQPAAAIVDDPAMPRLAEALDPARAGKALSETGIDPRGFRLSACRLLRHKPGRRALIEYTWTHPDGGTLRMLGKMRAKGLDRRTYMAMRDLHARGFAAGQAGNVDVPAPLALAPRLDLWLQERVNGEPAWSALRGSDGVYWGRRIAEAIHRLHASGYQTDRTHGLDDELDILATRLHAAADSLPRLRSRILAVNAACRQLAATLPKAHPVCIHRDFYPDQTLVDGDQVHLLDFDLLCMGDPALDVGNYLAHLIEHGLRVHHDVTAYAAASDALRRRYASLSGVPRMSESIRVHTLLSLARHIHISTQLPGRAAFTEHILTACEALLEIQSAHVIPDMAPISS